jgi:hypothetical protein
MRLKINDLQRVAGEAMNAESEAKALREEIVRVLGQRVVVEAPIGRVAADACQVIDADEMSSLHPASKFDKGLMLRYTRHGNPHVRKLAARVVSAKHLTRMLDDTNSLVRAEAAKRADMKLVSEALNRHPDDDGLYDTYASRLLCEDGTKQPKVTDDEPFDMYGDEPLGDAAKQQPGPELSDTWYKNRAFEFMQDYGTNIEYAWEETLVKVYCDAMHTTSGVEVERDRLLKAIKDLIEEKEDRALERDGLKEVRLSGFNRMVACRGCGKRTHSNVQGAGLDLCRKCFEQTGLENEHFDGMHDAQPDPDCELCTHERGDELHKTLGLKEAHKPKRRLNRKPNWMRAEDKLRSDAATRALHASNAGSREHPAGGSLPATHKGFAFGDTVNLPLNKPMKTSSLRMVDDMMRFLDSLDALGYKDKYKSKTPDYIANASEDTITIKSQKMAEDPTVHEIFLDAGVKEDSPSRPRVSEATSLDEAADDYYFDASGDVPQCPRCGKLLSGSPGCFKCDEPGHCDFDQQKMMPEGVDEAVDPVSSLAPHLGTQEFIELAEQVFSIRKSTVPSGIRKHRLGEANAHPTSVPIVGKLPENRSSFTSEDERALDEFCKRWSKCQASTGEPFELRWDPHPDQAGKVGFRLELF